MWLPSPMRWGSLPSHRLRFPGVLVRTPAPSVQRLARWVRSGAAVGLGRPGSVAGSDGVALRAQVISWKICAPRPTPSSASPERSAARPREEPPSGAPPTTRSPRGAVRHDDDAHPRRAAPRSTRRTSPGRCQARPPGSTRACGWPGVASILRPEELGHPEIMDDVGRLERDEDVLARQDMDLVGGHDPRVIAGPPTTTGARSP